jgi:hypothetical protein
VVDFQHMQQRTAALVTLGGWSNVSPPPDYAWLVNEGLRIFTRKAQHNREELLISLVVGQSCYRLPADTSAPTDARDWIHFFDDALYNVLPCPGGGLALIGSSWLPQATENQMRLDDRSWRQYPPSVPIYWYWGNVQEMAVWPPPSQSVLMQWRGVRHMQKLVASIDSPAINEDYHEAVCLFAAWHHGKLYARGAEREIVAGYAQEAQDLVNDMKQNMASKEATLTTRTVSRPAQEYMPAGQTSLIQISGSRR